MGIGIVQLSKEPDSEQNAVTLVAADDPLAEGWCHVFDGVERFRSAMSGGLSDTLTELLSSPEIGALVPRCELLLQEARFPSPRGQMPAVRWPPF